MNELEIKIRSRIRAHEQCLSEIKNGKDHEDVLTKYGIGEIEDPWYLCESPYNTIDELCGLLGEKWEGERGNYLGV